MKTYVLFYLTFLLASRLVAQDFSVCIAVAKYTLAGTGKLDGDQNPEKGATFVLSGIIYPGDYFDTFCPDDMNCGIRKVHPTEPVYEPQHIGFAVGRWDSNAQAIRDVGEALQNGGIPTYSTQTFTFKDDFAPCPGCFIVTEGKDLFGATENVVFKRAISGGTTEEYRLMRGEVEQIILKQPENLNVTGGYNMKVTFHYEKH